MRYITLEDVKIFEEEEQLAKKAREAREAWLSEVERSYNGEIKYEDTKTSFDRYIEAHNKWRKFFDENHGILLAQTK